MSKITEVLEKAYHDYLVPAGQIGITIFGAAYLVEKVLIPLARIVWGTLGFP